MVVDALVLRPEGLDDRGRGQVLAIREVQAVVLEDAVLQGVARVLVLGALVVQGRGLGLDVFVPAVLGRTRALDPGVGPDVLLLAGGAGSGRCPRAR